MQKGITNILFLQFLLLHKCEYIVHYYLEEKKQLFSKLNVSSGYKKKVTDHQNYLKMPSKWGLQCLK